MKLVSYLLKISNDFASRTSITGFDQILRSAHWAEKVFWTGLIVTGVVLAIRDCSEPVIGYMNEESYSTTSFLKNNTISFPGASLCVQVDTKKLPIKHLSSLEDRSRIEQFVVCLTNSSCYNNEKRFFFKFKDEIFASAVLLSHYTALEAGRGHFSEELNNTHFRALKGFYEALVGSKVSSAHLTTMLGDVLCRAMNFKAVMSHKQIETTIDFCKTAPLSWFGIPPKTDDETDLLCYNIENLTQFQSVEDNYDIYFYPFNVLERQADPFYDRTFAYLSIDGGPVTTDLDTTCAFIPFDKCSRIFFNLVQRITLMSKRSTSCAAQESYFHCTGRCYVDEYAANCNCSAVNFERYMSDYGSLLSTSCFTKYVPGEYASCPITVKASRKKRSCGSRCLARCTNDILSIEKEVCRLEKHYANTTRVSYGVWRMSYLLVEEKPKYEISALVSNVGGILGLWLGAGFVGLLEAVIFLPKALLDYVLCKKWEDKAEEEPVVKLDEIVRNVDGFVSNERYEKMVTRQQDMNTLLFNVMSKLDEMSSRLESLVT